MPTPPPSRPTAPLATPGLPTLQNVLEHLRNDVDLPPLRRRDLCSAVRTVGRVLGNDLHQIAAHPRLLRERLKRVKPAAAGFSRARWTNVRSLLNKALAKAGVTSVPGRSLAPLTGSWRSLYEALASKRLKDGLSRFMRYASALGLEPGDVTDAVMDGFLHALEDESLVRHPRIVHRRACACWNKACEQIPGWPQRRLSPPRSKRADVLRWDAFPPTLRDDTERWLAVLAGQDLLAENVPARPVRPATVVHRREQVRLFAGALVRRGRDAAQLRSLRDLVAMDNVREGLRFFLDRAGGATTSYVHDMASTLKSIARHWVRVDAAHLEQMKAICTRLKPKSTGMTAKNRSRLRQFDDAAVVDALLGFPSTIMSRVRRKSAPDRRAALDVQIAVAVELLTMAPIRIGNLVAIDIERHLLWTQQAGRGRLHLVFPPADVKNRQDLEFPLPPETAQLIQTYCRSYRPLLLERPSPWLFPGRAGRPKAQQGFREQIKSRVREATGIELNPHLFRHIASKLYLDTHPGGYAVVSRVLGHRSLATTAAFYSGTETAAAVRHFDEAILARRSRSRTPAEPPPGRKQRRTRVSA
jgi:integrase